MPYTCILQEHFQVVKLFDLGRKKNVTIKLVYFPYQRKMMYHPMIELVFTFSDTFFQLANQSLDPALQKLAKVLI